MRHYLLKINPLISGIFLMTWSMNAAFMFGTFARHVFLALGFVLIVIAGIISPNKGNLLPFFLKSIAVYSTYILIELLGDHEIFGLESIVFGWICIITLNVGYVISKNFYLFEDTPKQIIIAFCILTIFGGILSLKYQITHGITGRKFDTAEGIEVHAIGIAYVNSILLLLQIYFFTKIKTVNVTKIVTLISIVATITVILSAQSKGAILSIGATLGYIVFLRFKKTRHKLAHLANILIPTIILLIFLGYLQSKIPFISEKIEGLESRFENLWSYTSQDQVDPSAKERGKIYYQFYENFDQIIPMGQRGYKPYPHNIFLEILMRWGVWGIPLLFFFVFSFYKAIKLSTKPSFYISPLTNLMITIFLFCFIQSWTSLSLEFNRMLWLGLGYLYGISNFAIVKNFTKKILVTRNLGYLNHLM
ncbi:O-antigen ligase family protein [Mangrovibacterium lignilyticum]|uniref:O-antigen ligase family protein n=1 Tax=Mangrovibacterium lignilyticum TaxID=2668052 RepID=UPI0013D0A6C9|nr:O-antigen ligase family protein [Mangrovibacterium lignilyticum]